MTQPKTDIPTAPRKRRTNLAMRGDPMVWLTGFTLAVAVLMVVGLVALIVRNGGATFWTDSIAEVRGTRIEAGKPVAFTALGAWVREDRFRVPQAELAALPEAARAAIVAAGGFADRRLLQVGNADLYGPGKGFRWVADYEIASERYPENAVVLERMDLFEKRQSGQCIGFLEAIVVDGKPVAAGEAAWDKFQELHGAARDRFHALRSLKKDRMGDVGHDLEQLDRRLKSAEFKFGRTSAEYAEAARSIEEESKTLFAARAALAAELAALEKEDARHRLIVRDVQGKTVDMHLSQIVRALQPNRMGWFAKLGVYLSRWWEFLWDEPREANTEGGVFPAIFGTVMMTLIMSLVVAPFGVITAVYLREYAKQGLIVSIVRIAVNNLAGVPSIVFGVFGVGFFLYTCGDVVDRVLYPELAAAGRPVFKTGGILWSALTLALLTVPVVIVATEEALAAVPRSMREGSLACGAGRWQTIWRIVLPRATPGIMTGLILAMARGAGEVAPLMLVGAVKLAPELPFDERFPFFHMERSFMHLGFHIYDVGFQSQDSEAARPMVYTTTLLLVGLTILLNVFAVWIRNRLKKRFVSGQF